MSRHLFRKRMGALAPETEEAGKWLSRIGEGVVIIADVKDPRRRSTQRHRYFFAILNLMWENSEATQRQFHGDFEAFRHYVLVKIGHCIIIQLKGGGEWLYPKSISFDKCPEVDFIGVLDKTLDLFKKRYGFDPTTMRGEADRRVGKYGGENL